MTDRFLGSSISLESRAFPLSLAVGCFRYLVSRCQPTAWRLGGFTALRILVELNEMVGTVARGVIHLTVSVSAVTGRDWIS